MADKEEVEKPVEGDQVVTPWEAKAGAGQAAIDYDKLISKLMMPGCQYRPLSGVNYI